jgi:hypothetical protein
VCVCVYMYVCMYIYIYIYRYILISNGFNKKVLNCYVKQRLVKPTDARIRHISTVIMILLEYNPCVDIVNKVSE